MTDTSIEIGEDLRRILLVARTSAERWGVPKGLTQDQAAHRAEISSTWYRNIENGYTRSAKASTLVAICEALGIDPDILSMFGYHSVAEELRIHVSLGNKVVLDLDRLSCLTEDEERILGPILDKLASTPARKRRKVA